LKEKNQVDGEFINIHTHNSGESEGRSIFNISLKDAAAERPEGWFSVGFHPWDTTEFEPDMNLLAVMASLPGCAAIGECGIDKLRGGTLEKQSAIFRQQAMLAETLTKPVIIHCVKAWPELVALKKAINPKVAWILHGFAGKPELAAQLTGQGFYLSFGAQILRRNSPAAASLEQIVPDRMFLETDESLSAIKEVYMAAAAIKRLSLEGIAAQIAVNFKNAYGIQYTPGMASAH
jgi:TatD DNase family protein